MTTLEENKDFRFLDFKNTEITGIELLMEEYLGVVYHYGKVRIVEDEQTGIAKMEFDYVLVHPGEGDIDLLTVDEKLHTIMGDILTYILTSQINDEARNLNTKKLNLF